MPDIPLSAFRKSFPQATAALEAMFAKGMTSDEVSDVIDNTPAFVLVFDDLMRKVGRALKARGHRRRRLQKDIEDTLVLALVAYARETNPTQTATRVQYRPHAQRLLAAE